MLLAGKFINDCNIALLIVLSVNSSVHSLYWLNEVAIKFTDFTLFAVVIYKLLHVSKFTRI